MNALNMTVHSATGSLNGLGAAPAPVRLAGTQAAGTVLQTTLNRPTSQEQDFQHALAAAGTGTVAAPVVAESVMRYMQMPQAVDHVGGSATLSVVSKDTAKPPTAGDRAVEGAFRQPPPGASRTTSAEPQAMSVLVSQEQRAPLLQAAVSLKPLVRSTEPAGRPRADSPAASLASKPALKRGPGVAEKRPAVHVVGARVGIQAELSSHSLPVLERPVEIASAQQAATKDQPQETGHPLVPDASPTEMVRQPAGTAPVQVAQVPEAILASPQVPAVAAMAVKPVVTRTAHAAASPALKTMERGTAPRVSADADNASTVAATPVACGGSAVAPAGSHASSAGASVTNSLERASAGLDEAAGPASSGRMGIESSSAGTRVHSPGSAIRQESSGAGTQDTGAATAYGDEAPRTLGATSHSLEVGLASSAHGWLRVRAELAVGGGVSASLVASNDHAASELHAGLAGMSAYLKGELVGVQMLSVSTAGSSGEASRTGGSSGTEGNAQNSGGHTRPGADERRPRPSNAAPDRVGDGHEFLLAVPAGVLPGANAGGWLSVRV